MKIGVLGAGAFGTALAIVLARAGRDVSLWGRDVTELVHTRQTARLPGVTVPGSLVVTNDLARTPQSDVLLMATPMQSLRALIASLPDLDPSTALVACCKGLDLQTRTGPSSVLRAARPESTIAVLTGPSFAADIARGLPTALTLACEDDAQGKALQQALSAPTLRLYRSTDVVGAELGGALKNVVAIACGAVMGAGLGDSARAALMTRGFAEMQRVAARLGADPETLTGLSGLGDLALTCNSDLSRNYRYGFALGRGEAFDASVTVEGAATAVAISAKADEDGIDLPICKVVADMAEGNLDMASAVATLLSRPLKAE